MANSSLVSLASPVEVREQERAVSAQFVFAVSLSSDVAPWGRSGGRG
jgi:hypothetical protein